MSSVIVSMNISMNYFYATFISMNIVSQYRCSDIQISHKFPYYFPEESCGCLQFAFMRQKSELYMYIKQMSQRYHEIALPGSQRTLSQLGFRKKSSYWAAG